MRYCVICGVQLYQDLECPYCGHRQEEKEILLEIKDRQEKISNLEQEAKKQVNAIQKKIEDKFETQIVQINSQINKVIKELGETTDEAKKFKTIQDQYNLDKTKIRIATIKSKDNELKIKLKTLIKEKKRALKNELSRLKEYNKDIKYLDREIRERQAVLLRNYYKKEKILSKREKHIIIIAFILLVVWAFWLILLVIFDMFRSPLGIAFAIFSAIYLPMLVFYRLIGRLEKHEREDKWKQELTLKIENLTEE